MSSSYVTSTVLIFFYALVRIAHSLDYSDLEALGLSCQRRDNCEGYRNTTPQWKRSCECDSACHTFKDCCIDVPKLPSGETASMSNMICFNYRENQLYPIYDSGFYDFGIYAVSRCNNNWSGPREVKEKCEGSADLSDPVGAAPVTSTSQAVTYRNLCCAECNNANMTSLKAFPIIVSCEGVWNMSEEQIMDQLSYNEQKKVWGLNRMNTEMNSHFTECEILYDLPDNLKTSVRYCRANIISECAQDWNRQRLKRYCDEYMAVVFGEVHFYRNPHCALCNHKSMADLGCESGYPRRILLPISARIDINRKDDNNLECSSNLIFDPFLSMCRGLDCAFPGRDNATEAVDV